MTTPEPRAILPEQKLQTALFVALALLAVFLPWTLAGMQLALALALIPTILMMARRPSISNFKHPFFFFLAIYAVLRVISAVLGPDPVSSLSSVLHTDWVVLTIPILICSLLWVDRLEKVLHILLISGAAVSLYAAFQFFFGLDLFRGRGLTPYGNYFRAAGGFNHYLTFAGNQLLLFGIALGFLLNEKRRGGRKKIYLAVMLLLLFSLVATYARSAWLGIILMVAVGTLLVNRKLFLYSAAGMLISVILAAILSPEFQERFISIFDLSQNENRLTLWRTSFKIIEAHPIWGFGPGNFDEAFFKYKVPGFYDATGHAHNDYINLAVNSGLLALLSWLGLWGSWFYFALKTYWQKELSEFDRKVLAGSILGITGIMLAAVFQCYWTDLENNIAWWFTGIMGAQVILRNQ